MESNYIPETINVPLVERTYKNGMTQHIKLTMCEDTLTLSWNAPVDEAYITMVDERYLNVEYFHSGRSYSVSCVAPSLNNSLFLKMPIWNSKVQTQISPSEIHYDFSQIEGNPKVDVAPERIAKTLTAEQRQQIAVAEFEKEDCQTLGHIAMLKLAKLGLSVNSENVEMNTEASFNNKRYSLKMTVEYIEIKP